MAFVAFDTVNVLLVLIKTSSGGKGVVREEDLWEAICQYHKNGGRYSFYPDSGYDPLDFALQYRDDIDKLVADGCVERTTNGLLKLKPNGRSRSAELTVPQTLDDLANTLRG